MWRIIFWIILIPVYGFAQRFPYTLKTAPLNYINFYQQSFDLQADVPLSSRWGVDIGTGVMLHSAVFSRFKDESFLGIKLQPGIKYYIDKSEDGSTYLALVYKYISVNNDRFVTAGRQGNQYVEWLLQRKHLTTQGVALRFGSQRYLGDRKRMFLEPYIGLGWRQLRVKEGTLPPDVEVVGENRGIVFQRRPGTYKTADFMMGFYLGWRLGKIQSR